MKFEQLTYFLETARTEHIGKAAKALHISPSAISHSIAQLEEELGRELFVKKGKRIFLTSHGKLLMERAEKLLREVQEIKEEVAAENLELQGHFRMAASHDLCEKYLTSAWVKLQNESQRLTGEVFMYRSSQVVAGVISKELDLGVCFSPVAHPELQQRALKTGQILIAARVGHPLFKKKEGERIRALSDYPTVLPKSFQGIDVCERHPVFERFKIKLNPTFLIDSYSVGLRKVAGSDAWSFMPDWLIEMRKSEVRVVKPPPGWEAPYQVSAVWSKDRPLTTAMKRLVDILATEFQSK
jgi:DNA-binding transcriptional LysR family regulator